MAKNNKSNQTTAQSLSQFANNRGLDISQVFDHFLEYIIWAHTLPEYGKPIKDWPYKPEDSKEFLHIYGVLINELDGHLKNHKWYDIFGRIYEDLIAGKTRRQSNGQFFTPSSVCDLMTAIASPDDEKCVGGNISDPTCGSGRNLLAFHAEHPDNYHIGEDVDKTCCLMTVCNFILHGVNGEVIWHNSLVSDDFKGGWRVNECLNNPASKYCGIPHVRPIDESEYRAPSVKKICDIPDLVTLQALLDNALQNESKESLEQWIDEQSSLCESFKVGDEVIANVMGTLKPVKIVNIDSEKKVAMVDYNGYLIPVGLANIQSY